MRTVLARVECVGTRLMTGALLTKMLEYLPILEETCYPNRCVLNKNVQNLILKS